MRVNSYLTRSESALLGIQQSGNDASQRWGIEFMGHNLGTAGTEIPLSSDLQTGCMDAVHGGQHALTVSVWTDRDCV